MLTAWVPAERSARFYGEYVQHHCHAHEDPQGFRPEPVSHNCITPFLKGVANRHFYNSARPFQGGFYFTLSTMSCQSVPKARSHPNLLAARMLPANLLHGYTNHPAHRQRYSTRRWWWRRAARRGSKRQRRIPARYSPRPGTRWACNEFGLSNMKMDSA